MHNTDPQSTYHSVGHFQSPSNRQTRYDEKKKPFFGFFFLLKTDISDLCFLPLKRKGNVPLITFGQLQNVSKNLNCNESEKSIFH